MGAEFRGKKYVPLLQESEMSAGRHSRNLLLGIDCYSITTVNPFVFVFVYLYLFSDNKN